ncbi:glycoside hydrolase family 95 protein [Paenibacillus gansuensis]|uniref:Glycoside hydrolase N-terminal domain-containing protein n=1 Tax=Paenibacillus gansuensis TaxID=306542 RepID=A0ABW5P7M1_9BACL
MNGFSLWFERASMEWAQGLPVGNGRLGAVIHGGQGEEVWSLSESTYWSGRPEPLAPPANDKAGLERMRKLFFEGDYIAGEALAQQMLQPAKRNFGTNLPLGKVRLQLANESGNRRRELKLGEALVISDYVTESGPVQSEVLASHADGVLAARIRSGRGGGVNFSVAIEGDHLAVIELSAAVGSGELRFSAQALETMHSDGTCGVRCEGILRLEASGGAVLYESGALHVRDADEAILYLAVSTDYRAKDDDWALECGRLIAQVSSKGFDNVKADHLSDYRGLYDRVQLELGDTPRSALPTDERIRLLAADPEGDPQLFALFYQYGRYLMIAGSREDSPLPLNLQGIWNDGEANRMQWSCDYHLDVNTQMNYYPAEAANLAECHLPLMRFVQDLAQSGENSARHFYDSEGWVAHVFTNAWGFASPGWETSWGLNVTGGLWIAAHLREHYLFGPDREFLANTAYPVLRDAARFFLDYMTIHPAYGWLVTGPSNSPENSFYPGGGERSHQLSMGATMDQMLVRELFEFVLDAARLLDADEELQRKLEKAATKLPPLQIGAWGQLQEWLEDFGEVQPDHRHLSHLYGLYPGDQISPLTTPELAAAAKQTLEGRSSRNSLEDVEFTLALFASCFARLRDGDAAYRQIAYLIGALCFDNLFTYSKAGIAGAETNIFVIDGNFGGTAAVTEMLLQSQLGEIDLLPALPAAWPNGSVRGLKARGGTEVAVLWENGRLKRAEFIPAAAGKLRIRSGEHTAELEVQAGVPVSIGSLLEPLHV